MSKGLFSNTGTPVSMADLDNENLAPGTPETAPISPEVTPSTTPVEKVEKTPTEEVKNEPVVITPPPAPVEVGFDKVKEFFEKKYGTKVETEDSLKGILDSASKVTDYEAKQKELSDLKEQYEILLSQADPLSMFSSEDAYKLEQFKKAFPDKDALTASQIFSAKDLKTVNDYDIVKWGYKMDYPGMKGGEDDLRSTIAKDLNIDPALEIDEWPISDQNRLNKMATEYRNKFETMKQIEGPKRIDVATIRQQRQTELETQTKTLEEGWNKVSPVIANDSKVLKIQINEPKEGEQPVYFEWDLGDGGNEKLSTLVKGMVSLGNAPSEEVVKGMKEALQQSLFWENRHKIIPALRKDIESRKEEVHLQETNNIKPLTDAERTDGSADRQKTELSSWIREDDSKFKSRKLL